MNISYSNFTNTSYINNLDRERIIYTDIDLINDFCDGFNSSLISKFLIILSLYLIIALIERFYINKDYKYSENLKNIVEFPKKVLPYCYHILALIIVIPYYVGFFDLDSKMLIKIFSILNAFILIAVAYIVYKRYIKNRKSL